jgi:rhodanese-related sulfurtransferase
MRLRLALHTILALVLGAGIAFGQDIAIDFIKVSDVQRLITEGAKVVLVDVRSQQEYLIRHIKGAVSMPLRAIEEHARELPRDGLVVLY